MNRMTRSQRQFQQRVPQPWMPPQRPRYRWRFRWSLVWVTLAILFVCWFLTGVRVGFEWEDVMRSLGVSDYPRYTRLAGLAIVGIALTLIVKVWRRS